MAVVVVVAVTVVTVQKKKKKKKNKQWSSPRGIESSRAVSFVQYRGVRVMSVIIPTSTPVTRHTRSWPPEMTVGGRIM